MKRYLIAVATLLGALVLLGASSTYPTAQQTTLKNFSLYLAQSYTVPADGGYTADGSVMPLPYDYGDAGAGYVAKAVTADSNSCLSPAAPCLTVAGLIAKIPMRINHTVSLYGDITAYDTTTIRALLSGHTFGPNGAVLVNGATIANWSPTFNAVTATTVSATTSAAMRLNASEILVPDGGVKVMVGTSTLFATVTSQLTVADGGTRINGQLLVTGDLISATHRAPDGGVVGGAAANLVCYGLQPADGGVFMTIVNGLVVSCSPTTP